jgi:Putative DNA-binding domain
MSLPWDLSITTRAHVESLISEHAVEGTYLEFKRDLPTRNDAGKHEFLADVSAFANSTGGDLVYGIDENGEGQAISLVAQEGNADMETRRLQDVLLNGVQPRIPGIQVQAVILENGFIVIVRVPQSWAGPHRVNTNQHFFIRESGRKRSLDVPELRGLFLRSELYAEKIRNFRTERLGKLISGERPHRLVPGALMIGHFIPTQSALGLVNIDPIPYMIDRYLPVLGTRLSNCRVNADGALAIRNPRPEGTHGYSQFFRNGYFETVMVLPYQPGVRVSLGCAHYEKNFIDLLTHLRAEYKYLGVGTEMTCMVSIIDADKVEIGLTAWQYNLDNHQGFFDRKMLLLPDILLQSELAENQALRPVFDLVWQSAGMMGSINYTDEGIWAPK